MYLPSLAQPGEPGATYIYAHARIGMFLPILDASLVNNGAAMIGMVVQVYTSDDRLFLYTVTQVRRHQRSLTDAVDATAQELWLQTSEGPSGAYPKVQLVARPLSSKPASYADAHPLPRPVVCARPWEVDVRGHQRENRVRGNSGHGHEDLIVRSRSRDAANPREGPIRRARERPAVRTSSAA